VQADKLARVTRIVQIIQLLQAVQNALHHVLVFRAALQIPSHLEDRIGAARQAADCGRVEAGLGGKFSRGGAHAHVRSIEGKKKEVKESEEAEEVEDQESQSGVRQYNGGLAPQLQLTTHYLQPITGNLLPAPIACRSARTRSCCVPFPRGLSRMRSGCLGCAA
jgi:hypothetical protein